MYPVDLRGTTPFRALILFQQVEPRKLAGYTCILVLMKTTLALAEGAAIVVLAVSVLTGHYLGTALAFAALVLLFVLGTVVRAITRGDEIE